MSTCDYRFDFSSDSDFDSDASPTSSPAPQSSILLRWNRDTPLLAAQQLSASYHCQGADARESALMDHVGEVCIQRDRLKSRLSQIDAKLSEAEKEVHSPRAWFETLSAHSRRKTVTQASIDELNKDKTQIELVLQTCFKQFEEIDEEARRVSEIILCDKVTQYRDTLFDELTRVRYDSIVDSFPIMTSTEGLKESIQKSYDQCETDEDRFSNRIGEMHMEVTSFEVDDRSKMSVPVSVILDKRRLDLEVARGSMNQSSKVTIVPADRTRYDHILPETSWVPDGHLIGQNVIDDMKELGLNSKGWPVGAEAHGKAVSGILRM
ncbi:uncharacterized protein L199_007806 [Kwoniella botswanensis]|uniref:uncharacterized protein n=1 Tax=Kwoniella botswanensis TaxID=1268659 RepID=UPI00315CDD7F